MPNSLAASCWVLPSKWHFTTAERYCPGRAEISSSSAGSTSFQGSEGDWAAGRCSANWVSVRLRERVLRFCCSDAFTATRYSQLPKEADGATDRSKSEAC